MAVSLGADGAFHKFANGVDHLFQWETSPPLSSARILTRRDKIVMKKKNSPFARHSSREPGVIQSTADHEAERFGPFP